MVSLQVLPAGKIQGPYSVHVLQTDLHEKLMHAGNDDLGGFEEDRIIRLPTSIAWMIARTLVLSDEDTETAYQLTLNYTIAPLLASGADGSGAVSLNQNLFAWCSRQLMHVCNPFAQMLGSGHIIATKAQVIFAKCPKLVNASARVMKSSALNMDIPIQFRMRD